MEELELFSPNHMKLVDRVSEHAWNFWQESWIHEEIFDEDDSRFVPTGPFHIQDVSECPAFRVNVPSLLDRDVQGSRMNVSLPFWYKHKEALGTYKLELYMTSSIDDTNTHLRVFVRELPQVATTSEGATIDFEVGMNVTTCGYVFYDNDDTIMDGFRKWKFSWNPTDNSISWKVDPRVEEHEGDNLYFPPVYALLESQVPDSRGDWVVYDHKYVDGTHHICNFESISPAHIIVSRSALAAFLCA